MDSLELAARARDGWDGSDWPEIWQGRRQGILDLGADRVAQKLIYGEKNAWVGIVETHTRPDGAPCGGYCLFAVPEADEYDALRRREHDPLDGEFVGSAHDHTTGTVTILAANNTITAVSRELFVLRRTGDDWRITNYMYNRPGGL